MVQFIEVASTADLAPGEAKCVEVAGKKMALFNLGGSFYAIDEHLHPPWWPALGGRGVGRGSPVPVAWGHLQHQDRRNAWSARLRARRAGARSWGARRRDETLRRREGSTASASAGAGLRNWRDAPARSLFPGRGESRNASRGAAESSTVARPS
jgi:hypothetical protein